MIKCFLRNLVLREKASSERYVEYLKKKGVEIGDDVHFFSVSDSLVDLTAPWLLTIGSHVNITRGVVILTHDYSWSVLKRIPENKGRVLGAQSPVKIGNNVFIGVNAVITRGVTVGDNVIIGAGSIVTKDCEPNSVYAGNPAKRIMSVEDFATKRQEKQFEEAKRLALRYRDCFSELPQKEVFHEYFMLFASAEAAVNTPRFKSQLTNCGNYEEGIAFMKNYKPMFNSYEDFLEACFNREQE